MLPEKIFCWSQILGLIFHGQQCLCLEIEKGNKIDRRDNIQGELHSTAMTPVILHDRSRKSLMDKFIYFISISKILCSRHFLVNLPLRARIGSPGWLRWTSAGDSLLQASSLYHLLSPGEISSLSLGDPTDSNFKEISLIMIFGILKSVDNLRR